MPPARKSTGPTIFRRKPGGPWWYDFRVAGKRYRRSTGTEDRRAAESAAWSAREDARTAAGRPGRGEGVDLAQLGGLDVERAVAEKNAGEKQQASIIACWSHITRLLGADTAPEAIDYPTAQGYVLCRRREGVKGQSIRKEIQALRRGLVIARQRGWLAEVPPDWPKISSDPPNPGQKGKLHPPAVLYQWLEALERDPRARGARLQAEVVLLTGLRAEESRRLTWAWVEDAPRDTGVPAVLRVPAAAAKNRKERLLGLTPRALELLAEARQGNAWDSPLMAGNHLRTAKKAVRNIGYHQSITLRDLRHCHATWAAQGTGDAAAAQAALGHSDLTTTQRYLSATIKRTAAASLAVSDHLDGHTRWSHGAPHEKAAPPTMPTGPQSSMVGVGGLEPPASCSRSRTAAPSPGVYGAFQ